MMTITLPPTLKNEALAPVSGIAIDRAVLTRAALSAYLSALRLEEAADIETIMARIRAADTMAHAAYAELYALLAQGADGAPTDRGGEHV